MRTTGSISDAVAWPFPCPQRPPAAIGLSRNRDLVRMLVDSLLWTVLGVIVAVLAI